MERTLGGGVVAARAGLGWSGLGEARLASKVARDRPAHQLQEARGALGKWRLCAALGLGLVQLGSGLGLG